MSPLTVNQGKGKLIDKCDALYVWHKEAIFRMALDAVGGDKDWALRLLEECMFTAYRYLDKFGVHGSDDSKSKMAAILQLLIDRAYSDVWKKLGVYGEYRKINVSNKDRFDVDQILIRNELTADLAKYVERMTNADKELVYLRYFMGFTEEELSKHYGDSMEEIENRIFLAKQKIAKMMTER